MVVGRFDLPSTGQPTCKGDKPSSFAGCDPGLEGAVGRPVHVCWLCAIRPETSLDTPLTAPAGVGGIEALRAIGHVAAGSAAKVASNKEQQPAPGSASWALKPRACATEVARLPDDLDPLNNSTEAGRYPKEDGSSIELEFRLEVAEANHTDIRFKNKAAETKYINPKQPLGLQSSTQSTSTGTAPTFTHLRLR